MCMNFGSWWAPPGKPYVEYIKSCASAVIGQLSPLGQSAALVGVTPMIGVNDLETEIFTLSDAQTLVKWANGEPKIGFISSWSLNRDIKYPSGGDISLDQSSHVNQNQYDFTRNLLLN